jgi:hypothetical protein
LALHLPTSKTLCQLFLVALRCHSVHHCHYGLVPIDGLLIYVFMTRQQFA